MRSERRRRPGLWQPEVERRREAENAPMSEALVHLYWLGESCFVLQAGKTRILTDPFDASFGYGAPTIQGVDVVTISHEHAGHNNAALAAGKPLLLRGLTPGSAEFNRIDQKVKTVRIFTVPSYHHVLGGTPRGRNAIFAFDVLTATPPPRIVHMGDFGERHVDAGRRRALGAIDVLLLPVGGYYTIGAAEARAIVAELRPRIVVPMHWKTERMPADYPTTDVGPFLRGKEDAVLNDVASGNHLTVTTELLQRAGEAGEPLIVPLDFGPPPEPIAL